MTVGRAGEDSQGLNSLQVGQCLCAQAPNQLQTSVSLGEDRVQVCVRVAMLEPRARDSQLQELYDGAAVASVTLDVVRSYSHHGRCCAVL